MNLRKKLGFLTLGVIAGSSSIIGLANANANQITSKTNKLGSETNEWWFDAKLIGAQEGRFELRFDHVCECELIDVSSDFLAVGDFNFNNGQFWYSEHLWTITSIGDSAFSSVFMVFNWHFRNSHITFPESITRIGKKAFQENGASVGRDEIIDITFSNKLEYIGDFAFGECYNLRNANHPIVLPNSLKYIGRAAFRETNIKEFDLTALDHVIDTNEYIFDWYTGTMYTHQLKHIWLKDQNMLDLYLKNKYWADGYDKNHILSVK